MNHRENGIMGPVRDEPVYRMRACEFPVSDLKTLAPTPRGAAEVLADEMSRMIRSSLLQSLEDSGYDLDELWDTTA